jgi:hypothetical protein
VTECPENRPGTGSIFIAFDTPASYITS